jgi:hypothetical protein
MIGRYWPILFALAALIFSLSTGRLVDIIVPFSGVIIAVGLIDFYRRRKI